MADPIEFYFDFSSPYGYLAAKQIDVIAADSKRSIKWCPILLGFIFKVTESKPLVQVPLKGEYSVRDMNRCAREKNIRIHYARKISRKYNRGSTHGSLGGPKKDRIATPIDSRNL